MALGHEFTDLHLVLVAYPSVPTHSTWLPKSALQHNRQPLFLKAQNIIAILICIFLKEKEEEAFKIKKEI